MVDSLITLWGSVVGAFSAILFTFRGQLLTKYESLVGERRRVDLDLDEYAKSFLRAFNGNEQDEHAYSEAERRNLVKGEDHYFSTLVAKLDERFKSGGIGIDIRAISEAPDPIVALRQVENKLDKHKDRIAGGTWIEFARADKYAQARRLLRDRDRFQIEIDSVSRNNNNVRVSMRIAITVLLILIVASIVGSFRHKYFALALTLMSIAVFIELVLHALGTPENEAAYFAPLKRTGIAMLFVLSGISFFLLAALTPSDRIEVIWEDDAPLVTSVRDYGAGKWRAEVQGQKGPANRDEANSARESRTGPAETENVMDKHGIESPITPTPAGEGKAEGNENGVGGASGANGTEEIRTPSGGAPGATSSKTESNDKPRR